jgi:mannose-6-phosphate isomerase-like protein (cupin superfamily)
MRRSIEEGKKYYVDPSKRTFVSKGWGYEDWIWNEQYCGKILFVKKGKKCSWHYHQKKDETFYVISGKLHLLYSENDDINEACEIVLKPQDAFHVPIGLRHRFIGLEDTLFVEVSSHHEDQDSIRVEKGD